MKIFPDIPNRLMTDICNTCNRVCQILCILINAERVTPAVVTAVERTNEVNLPMNGVNNDWLPVEAEAHQSWPPIKSNSPFINEQTTKKNTRRAQTCANTIWSRSGRLPKIYLHVAYYTICLKTRSVSF